MTRLSLFNAMLFDLAQRGHVRLRTEKKQSWWQSDEVFAEEIDLQGDLSEREYALLSKLREYPKLSDFGQKSQKLRQSQLKELRQELTKAGYYRSLDERRTTRLTTGFFTLLAGFVALLLIPQPWTGPVAGVGLAIGIFGLITGIQGYVLTERGSQQQSNLKAYVSTLRREVEGMRDRGEARQAVHAFLRYLPWLTLDNKVDKGWLEKIQKKLKGTDESFELPDWLLDPTGEMQLSDTVAAFTPLMIIMSQSSAAAGGAGAAGAGGGAGGGGGAG